MGDCTVTHIHTYTHTYSIKLQVSPGTSLCPNRGYRELQYTEKKEDENTMSYNYIYMYMFTHQRVALIHT